VILNAYHVVKGLKEMMSQAQEYNQLMKDIPLNELIAASDLDAVRIAMCNILSFFKKIRTIKYPLKRAMQFLMTISTDLCEQIIQVFCQSHSKLF
jgi:dynein heavy chain 1